MTNKKTIGKIDQSAIDSIAELLDEAVRSGAIAATAIITMGDGKQVKITGQDQSTD